MERGIIHRARDCRLAGDLTARQLRWGLGGAVALHIIILGLYVFSVIPQIYHPADRLFWLHQGGDNVGYFEQARGLLTGDLQPNKYPLGFPILMLPFMVVLQPAFQEDLLEPVSAFWGLVMFPLGQLILADLAHRLTGRRWLALLTVIVWTILPLSLYLLLRLIASAEFAEIATSHLMWAQMLSDGPAALFTLLIAAVYLRRAALGWRVGVLLGFLGGFLMLIRLTGVLSVVMVAALLLLHRRWQTLAALVIVTIIVFAPQMIYNTHFFGSPLTSGYQVLDEIPPYGLFNLRYLTDAVDRVGLLPSLAILVAAAVFSLIGLTYLWRRYPTGAALIGLTIVAYLTLYSVYYYSWTGSFSRFLIPIYPFLALVVAGVVGFIAVRE